MEMRLFVLCISWKIRIKTREQQQQRRSGASPGKCVLQRVHRAFRPRCRCQCHPYCVEVGSCPHERSHWVGLPFVVSQRLGLGQKEICQAVLIE